MNYNQSSIFFKSRLHISIFTLMSSKLSSPVNLYYFKLSLVGRTASEFSSVNVSSHFSKNFYVYFIDLFQPLCFIDSFVVVPSLIRLRWYNINITSSTATTKHKIITQTNAWSVCMKYINTSVQLGARYYPKLFVNPFFSIFVRSSSPNNIAQPIIKPYMQRIACKIINIRKCL